MWGGSRTEMRIELFTKVAGDQEKPALDTRLFDPLSLWKEWKHRFLPSLLSILFSVLFSILCGIHAGKVAQPAPSAISPLWEIF